MHTNHLLIYALLVSGCALTPALELPSLPAGPVPVPVVHEAPVTPPYCPLDVVQVVLVEKDQASSVPPFPMPIQTPTKKGERPLSPLQVVTQGQKAARVEPTEKGYCGGNGEQVYPWIAGKVYTIYLSKQQGTGIFLPPGERLVSGLYLDPEAYEVQTKRAGVGEGAYDALTIRPTGDRGEVGAFLLTESGRRYLLHLVVGSVGMLAVTFEGPRVTQARTPAPALVLLRPPP